MVLHRQLGLVLACSGVLWSGGWSGRAVSVFGEVVQDPSRREKESNREHGHYEERLLWKHTDSENENPHKITLSFRFCYHPLLIIVIMWSLLIT